MAVYTNALKEVNAQLIVWTWDTLIDDIFFLLLYQKLHLIKHCHQLSFQRTTLTKDDYFYINTYIYSCTKMSRYPFTVL